MNLICSEGKKEREREKKGDMASRAHAARRGEPKNEVDLRQGKKEREREKKGDMASRAQRGEGKK